MMTRFYPGFAITSRQSGNAALLGKAAIFSSVLLACSGCEGGPTIPLGFGPAFDNLFGLLLLLLVGAIAYRLLSSKEKGSASHASGSAEAIARARYARGEITEAEYSQIMRTLRARPVIR
jgi:uncharacterized membrane protein